MTMTQARAAAGRDGPAHAAPHRRPAKPVRPVPPRFAGRGINLLYLPALALVGLFSVYPMIRGLNLSLMSWDGFSPTRSFVGLDNYLRLTHDLNFGLALKNTLIYGFGSTLFQQILGLALALALDRAMRGRTWARAIIYLPVLVSPVVMGTMYYLLFSYKNGGINDIIVAFGGERAALLSSPTGSIAIIVALNSIQFMGVSMIIYLAGLQAIPTHLFEAADIDGASTWTKFRYITIPMLQPAFVTSIIFNLIGGLKLFDVIQVLTGGGPGYATHSVSTLIGKTYFGAQNAGYAAAMGIVLFALIALFTVVLNTLLNKRRVEM